MRFSTNSSTSTAGVESLKSEDFPLAEVRFFHGIHFSIKYVGCMDVPCPRARSEVVAAMRRVRYEFKAQKMSKTKVDMSVSIGGIKVILTKNADVSWSWDEEESLMMSYQLSQIYYLAQDARDDKICSFITKELGGYSYRCHVFKARKRVHGQQLIRTIARALEVFEMFHSDELSENSPKTLMAQEKAASVSTSRNLSSSKGPVVRQSAVKSLLSSKELLESRSRLTRQSLQLHDSCDIASGAGGERVGDTDRKISNAGSNATSGTRANFLISSYLSNSHLTGQPTDPRSGQAEAAGNSTLNSAKLECSSNVNSSSYDSGAFSSETETSDDPGKRCRLPRLNSSSNRLPSGQWGAPNSLLNPLARPDLPAPASFGSIMPPYIAVPAYIDMSQLWGAQAAEQLGVLSQLSQVKDQIDKQQMESAATLAQAQALREQFISERRARQEAEAETRAVMDQSSTLMAAVQQLLTSVQSLDQSISPSKNDKTYRGLKPPKHLQSVSRGVNSNLVSYREIGHLRTRKKSCESDAPSSNRFLTITPIAEETNSNLSLSDQESGNNGISAISTGNSTMMSEGLVVTQSQSGSKGQISDRPKLRAEDISFEILTRPAILAKLTAKYDAGVSNSQHYDYIRRPRKHSLI